VNRRTFLTLRTAILPILSLALSWSVLPAGAQQGGQTTDAPPPLEKPRPLTLPSVVEQTLPNGLKLVLLEDHRQPALWLRLAVPGGSIRDPQDRVGVAQMTAALLDKGAGDRTAPQIAELVDGIGASLEASAGDDFLSISASGLSGYTDTLFQLLADVTLRPKFPADELERARTRVLNELQFSLSQPATMANAAMDRLVYGAYPYGNLSTGTPKTLAAITQQDLVKFHDTYFAPNAATLFLVGDITPAQALAQAQAAFGGWARKEVPAPPTAPTRPAAAVKPQITIIDRPGAAQTEVRIGALTTGYNDPNRIVGSVATAVLGLGQFEGRLTKEIRVKRGLTYGAASFFQRHQEAGEFEISTFTKNASTGEVVKIALDEANKMTGDDTPPDELADRKTFLTGSFAVSVATPNGVLARLVPAVLYGNGPADLTTYTDKVTAVTPSQIREVMSTLNLTAPQIVLVGDAKAISDQVKPLGDVRVIPFDSVDLLSPTLQSSGGAAPAAGSSVSTATPEELAAGKARLADIIKAHGGDAFLNIKTLQAKGKGTLTPPGQAGVQKIGVDSLSLTIVSPDKGRLALTTGIGEIILGVPGGGGGAWLSVLGQVQDAPADVAGLVSLFNPGQMLGYALQKGFVVRPLPDNAGAKPLTTADGKPLAGLSITDDHGNVTDLYAEQQTNLVRRLVVHSARGDLNVVLGDYHTTDGVQLPGALRLDQGTTTLFDFTFNSFALNQSVDDKTFARPQ
jgi:predicted Zn-dependent peptidase